MSITLSAVPSRISGVAPLAVFFDATGTTSTATIYPFHEILYAWDFGDVMAGTWAVDSKPKNKAFGATAAHVFEEPGTYTVKLTAMDMDLTVSTTTLTITVADPDVVYAGGSTFCFSQVGNFVGAPAGANLVSTTLWSDIQSRVAAGRRLLLRAGETWTATGAVDLGITGPVTIGKFSAGAAPLIEGGNFTVFQIGSGTDIRLMDLEIDGNGFAGGLNVYMTGYVQNILALRLNNHDAGGPFHFDLGAGLVHDGVYIVDCAVNHGVSGVAAVYGGAAHYAVMGCTITGFHDHVMRTRIIQKGVIQHCNLSNASDTQHLIKMNAPYWNDSGSPNLNGKYTEYVMCSDNRLNGYREDWQIAAAPKDGSLIAPGSDQRVQNVIFERNFHVFGVLTSCAYFLASCYITVRNCVTIASATGNSILNIAMQRRGQEPAAHHGWFYGNSVYSAAGVNLRLVALEPEVDTVVVRNNGGYAPSAGARIAVHMPNGSASNVTQSNNLVDVNPLFTVTPPVAAADFKPQAGSPWINAGYALTPNPFDFQGLLRPTPNNDIGAFDRSAVTGEVWDETQTYKTQIGITDNNFISHPPPNLADPVPAIRVPYTDPIFGARVKRVTEYTAGHDARFRHEYSRMCPISADNRYACMYTGSGWYRIIDLTTGAAVGVDFSASRGDPEFMTFPNSGNFGYFRADNRIRRIDMTTGVITTMMTIKRPDGVTDYYSALTHQEGKADFLGRFMCFTCYYDLAGANAKTPFDLVVVDTRTWTIRSREVGCTRRGNWVSMSPLGKYVIIGAENNSPGPNDYTLCLDRDTLVTQRQLQREPTHDDLCIGADGEEYFVYYAVTGVQMTEAGTTVPYLVSVRLSDGVRTKLQRYYDPEIASPSLGNSTWISGIPSYSHPGWVLVSTLRSIAAGPRRFQAECFLLNIHTAEVRRLMHHHSYGADYYNEPQATGVWDGSMFLVASNWNTGTVRFESYAIEAPDGSSFWPHELSGGSTPPPPPPAESPYGIRKNTPRGRWSAAFY